MSLSTAPKKSPQKATIAGVKKNLNKKRKREKKKKKKRKGGVEEMWYYMEGKDHPGHLKNGEWIEA